MTWSLVQKGKQVLLDRNNLVTNHFTAQCTGKDVSILPMNYTGRKRTE